MTTYAIRRILVIIPIFFAVTIIVFSLTQLAPGNIIDYYTAANPELLQDVGRMNALKERLGLNKPVYIQYLKWLKKLVCFDFGYSFATNRKISKEIGSRIGASITLYLVSHLIGWPISIIIGVYSAIKPNSLLDHFSRGFGLIGISMPVFWLGIMLIFIFSVQLGWFPTSGFMSGGHEYNNVFHLLGNKLWHLVLPGATLALRNVAATMRATRAEMLEVLQKDYIVTARSKGVRERLVYVKHALRNSLMPVITMIGLSMGYILSGAVLTETVFAWPGIGRFLIQSVHTRDYPAVMAVTVMAAAMMLLANLVTDLTYGFINPKVRYD